MYTIEEFEKYKVKVLKYILYKKRSENEIRRKFGKEIEENFNKLMILMKQGKKVIFTDVENDMKIMLKELKGDINV